MSNQLLVLEIVKWKPKDNVADKNMIEVADNMTEDQRSFNGFLYQAFYKSAEHEWIDVYYRETEEDAHASTISMADKASFIRFSEMIEPDSATIEIMHQLQASGSLTFGNP